MINELEWQIGKVIDSVPATETEPAKITIKSYLDGSEFHDVLLDNVAAMNHQPKEGASVVFLRYVAGGSEKVIKPIHFFETSSADYPVQPGDVHLQSANGKSYVSITNQGKVQLVDGTCTNKIELHPDEGTTIQCDTLTIKTLAGNSITMDSLGNVNIEKRLPGQTMVTPPLAKISMDTLGNITINSPFLVTINNGVQGAARIGDSVAVSVASDAVFWTWLTSLATFVTSAGFPGGPPVASTATGNITSGSVKTLVG
jgi:hypothetical protein